MLVDTSGDISEFLDQTWHHHSNDWWCHAIPYPIEARTLEWRSERKYLQGQIGKFFQIVVCSVIVSDCFFLADMLRILLSRCSQCHQWKRLPRSTSPAGILFRFVWWQIGFAVQANHSPMHSPRQQNIETKQNRVPECRWHLEMWPWLNQKKNLRS